MLCRPHFLWYLGSFKQETTHESWIVQLFCTWFSLELGWSAICTWQFVILFFGLLFFSYSTFHWHFDLRHHVPCTGRLQKGAAMILSSLSSPFLKFFFLIFSLLSYRLWQSCLLLTCLKNNLFLDMTSIF